MQRKVIRFLAFLAVYASICLIETKAFCFPPPLTSNFRQQGEVLAGTSQGVNLGRCEHQLTNIKILTTNRFSHILVTELFRNQYLENALALYSLPLPENALVESVWVSVGEQVIRSDSLFAYDDEIFKEYVEDTQEIANRLNQIGSDKFTQFIVHLAPGEEIEVRVTYREIGQEDQRNETAGFSGEEPYEEDYCQMGVLRRINRLALLIYLALFSIMLYVAGAIIRRSLVYYFARSQSRYFVPRIVEVLRLNQLAEALKISGYYETSPIAKTLKEVLKTAVSVAPTNRAFPELLSSSRSRAVAKSDADLKKGLRRLKLSGWLALILGFLGTTLSLLDVFRAAMVVEGTAWSAIAGGISESFMVVLFGLLIALPALWAYRYFASKVKEIGMETDTTTWELLVCLLTTQHQVQITNQMQCAIWSDC
jgi:biopolymer transport protein ExbB/TolQ